MKEILADVARWRANGEKATDPRRSARLTHSTPRDRVRFARQA